LPKETNVMRTVLLGFYVLLFLSGCEKPLPRGAEYREVIVVEPGPDGKPVETKKKMLVLPPQP
jgi:hypothetical protein